MRPTPPAPTLLLLRAASLALAGSATLATGVVVGGWAFVSLGSIGICLALDRLAASPRLAPCPAR